MRYRILLLATVLASGLAAAETIAVDNGIAVKQSDVPTPTRGMTMDQVAGKFGAPATKVPAVGQAAHLALGISGIRGVFRARTRHSQRRRQLSHSRRQPS